jgi:serine/threonine-protein kinase
MFDSLGHYKVLDKIGTGGIGDVYRARDTRHGRTVAIKIAGPHIVGDDARRERFLADARAAVALSHPNIADLFEIGEDQGALFLVFEFVPGEPLSAVIAGRPLNPRRAVDLAIQIADALADAHAAGIVHGDLDPSNLIVTPKGNAKILDFGLSEWTSGGAERRRVAEAGAATSGASLASAPYMSPEQALGEQIDHRTDLFSLGVMLFEMLTGKLPFSPAAATPLALQIVQAQPPPSSSVNKALPPEIDGIVARALAKSLDQRYESAATMAAELRSFAAVLEVRSEATAAARAPVVVRGRRRSKARWMVFLLIAAALAVMWLMRGAITGLLP